MPEESAIQRRRKEYRGLSPSERLKRFAKLQADAWKMMSAEGWERFYKRNIRKRIDGRPRI